MDNFRLVDQYRRKTMRGGAAVLFVAIVAGLAGHGAARAADLTEGQIREGLAKLSVLMAADVPTTARWVLVENQGRRWAGIFTHREDPFPSEGNAFLLEEKPTGEARIMIASSGSVMSVRSKGKEGGAVVPSTGAVGTLMVAAGEYVATWKDANVAKDVAAAVEWLKKTAKKGGPGAVPAMGGDPFAGADGDEANTHAMAHMQTALLWAALLHHTGHANEALALAQTAMAGKDEKQRKQLLDGLFSRVATGAYSRTMMEFGKHRDWAKLRDDLAALVKKYPMGWTNRDAVRVALLHITARAQLPTEAPLKTRQPLPEADQKLLLAWLKEMESGKQPSYWRWTLPPIEGQEDGDPFVPDSRRAMSGNSAAFPDSHGLKAVPLLAALLTDDTLTAAGTAMHDHYSRGFYSGGDEEAVTKLRMAYNSLTKPHTRAELAWQTLQNVLPSEMRMSDDEESAARADDVLAWYASVKDASPANLAMTYLEAGEKDELIIAHAMTVTDPKQVTKLDALMLEHADAWNPGRLEPYVAKLGPEKGAAFVAKLRQKLEADMARYGEGRTNNMVKQMEAGLKRLDAAAKGEKKDLSLQSMLKTLAAIGPDISDEAQIELEEVYEKLPGVTSKLSLEERVRTMLPALAEFKSPRLAAQTLGYVFQREQPDGKSTEASKKLLMESKPHWLRLMAMKESSEGDPYGDGLLMYCVFSIEYLARGEAQSEALQYLATLDDRGMAKLREHAITLLEGKEPPPLPEAKSIDEKQRQQVLAEWGQKSADQAARDIEALEIQALMTLNETLTREKELPENLKTVMWRIGRVDVAGSTDTAAWQAWKGKAVDKESLIALAKTVSTSPSRSVISVSLRRMAPALGWKLTIKESDKLDEAGAGAWLTNGADNVGEHLPKLAKRVSAGLLQQGRFQANWTWYDAPIVDGKEPAKEEKKEDLEEEAIVEAREAMASMRAEEGKSWETVQQMAEARDAAAGQLGIYSASSEILVKPEEAEKKAEENN
jgi:hypothetical protein